MPISFDLVEINNGPYFSNIERGEYSKEDFYDKNIAHTFTNKMFEMSALGGKSAINLYKEIDDPNLNDVQFMARKITSFGKLRKASVNSIEKITGINNTIINGKW